MITTTKGKLQKILFHGPFCVIEDIGVAHHMDLLRVFITLDRFLDFGHELVPAFARTVIVQLQKEGCAAPIGGDKAPGVGAA